MSYNPCYNVLGYLFERQPSEVKEEIKEKLKEISPQMQSRIRPYFYKKGRHNPKKLDEKVKEVFIKADKKFESAFIPNYRSDSILKKMG